MKAGRDWRISMQTTCLPCLEPMTEELPQDSDRLVSPPVNRNALWLGCLDELGKEGRVLSFCLSCYPDHPCVHTHIAGPPFKREQCWRFISKHISEGLISKHISEGLLEKVNVSQLTRIFKHKFQCGGILEREHQQWTHPRKSIYSRLSSAKESFFAGKSTSPCCMVKVKIEIKEPFCPPIILPLTLLLPGRQDPSPSSPARKEACFSGFQTISY